MAKPKLTDDQRAALLEWLAAGYDVRLIREWFKERSWPELSRGGLTYYRTTYEIDIENLRAARLDSAINSGLALKEERIARLSAHADELEKIKWEPDKNGRLWNEKAWREVLGEIAAEMGHRKQAITIEDVTNKPDSELVEELFSIANRARARAGADDSGGVAAPSDAGQPAGVADTPAATSGTG